MKRAVIDTNVVLSSQLSTSAKSPNIEIIARWVAGEFVWLHTQDILDEYLEKLLENAVPLARAVSLLAKLKHAGESIPIGFFHVRHYPTDMDDTIFLLAALNGMATHLVTYDEHLELVSVHYPEFSTCRPLEFLLALRA